MGPLTLEQKLLEKVTDIATLPFVIRKLMSTLSNPKSSAKDLARIISRDKALSVKVLKMVNSAYYGFQGEISNINHAVVVLGNEALRSLALSIASHSAFFKGEGVAFFNRRQLWLHSLGTAIYSKYLAKNIVGSSRMEDFFAAGLIHDVGKVIMDQYAPALFHKVIMLTMKEKTSIYCAEKQILGITHPEIGRAAAIKWNFPVFLSDAIMFHHEPSRAGDSWEAAAIIHLANYCCKTAPIGENGDQMPPVLDETVRKSINLTTRAIELISQDVQKELTTSKDFLDMI